MTEPPLLLALDLTGSFVFAVNGALTGRLALARAGVGTWFLIGEYCWPPLP